MIGLDMKEPLFKKVSMKDFGASISIENNGKNPKYTYIDGYYEAGKILIENIDSRVKARKLVAENLSKVR